MNRLILSLWFPLLATERLERREPTLAAQPFATFLESRGQMILGAVNPLAMEAGLTPGMTLANARAILPDIVLREGDPAAERAMLDRLRGWAERYTPLAALDGVDGLFLDVTGCGHLFGGEAAMMADCLDRLDRLGVTARAGLAPTPLGAAALARFRDDGGSGPPVLIPGELRAALDPLPVEALRLDAAAADGLHRVGLHRIGDIAPMPRSALAARYGLGLVDALDRALGEVGDPISPARAERPWRVRLGFPDPIGLPDDIACAVRRLVGRMTERLAVERRGCRRLELTVFRVDGDRQSLTVGASRAVNDPDHLARLFGERLGSVDPGFGIETMVLTALMLEDLAPAQLSVQTGDAAGHADSESARRREGGALALLTDRLASRLGEGALTAPEAVQSHLPERAARYRSLHDRGPGEKAGAPAGWRADRLALRPTLLVTPPEPVALPRHPGPAGGGGALLAGFRWRGRDRQVAALDGPERIAPEWWRDDAAGPRDYFRVRDGEGAVYWMFRTPPAAPGGDAGWYLQGVYA